MAQSSCETCAFRARHDRNPRSLLGRIWRWHANWCPGWKSFMQSLPKQERVSLAQRYGQKKFMQ